MVFPTKRSIRVFACNERLIFQDPQFLLLILEYGNVCFLHY